MPHAPVNGIDICYETRGDASRPPLVLVCGLGMQLVGWGEDFFERLVDEGYFVVAHDNRDAGLSTHLSESGLPDVLALVSRQRAAAATGAAGRQAEAEAPPPVPYLLGDMADDTAGLLDVLGIESAHVLGVSMGGMIAQELVVRHPGKVRSLVSVMSTTGAPDVGQPRPEAAVLLMGAPPRNRDEAMDGAVEAAKLIGSPGYRIDVERERRLAGEAFDRSNDPAGVARQLAAILASKDRTPALGHVSVPTLVVHGTDDPLVTPSGGRATAAAVPGAELLMIEGMGHSLPPQVWDEVLRRVSATSRRADGETSKDGR